MAKLLTDQYFSTFVSLVDVDIALLYNQLKEQEWNFDNFRFYTAVSVMSSSRIEGETLEVDSYVKHKLLNIEYLPNLTEKPNDLYKAYEFARDNVLSLENFLTAHTIATEHLLPPTQRGLVRSSNMVIMEQHTNRIKYEAANSFIVETEFERFWIELYSLLNESLNIEEVFYYSALIHIVFVKIHPFNDGNGRTGRLLEKWFLASKLDNKAWFIASESNYYQNLEIYYNNLARVGLFYENLNFEKALPFLCMLPNALRIKK